MSKTAIFVIFLLKIVNSEYCYSTDENRYGLFATRTSYFEVDNENSNPIVIDGKIIGHSNWDHATSSKRGRSERFI